MNNAVANEALLSSTIQTISVHYLLNKLLADSKIFVDPSSSYRSGSTRSRGRKNPSDSSSSVETRGKAIPNVTEPQITIIRSDLKPQLLD